MDLFQTEKPWERGWAKHSIWGGSTHEITSSTFSAGISRPFRNPPLRYSSFSGLPGDPERKSS